MKYRLMVSPGRRVVGEEHEYEKLARQAAINALPNLPGSSILIQCENTSDEDTQVTKMFGPQPWVPVDTAYRFPDGSVVWENDVTQEQAEEFDRLTKEQDDLAEVGNQKAQRKLTGNLYNGL